MSGNEVSPLGLAGVVTPHGAHVLAIYEGREAVERAAVEYFEAGLAVGEAGLWITASADPRQRLERAAGTYGGLIGQFVARGVETVAFRDWYFPKGRFDAALVAAQWNARTAAVTAGGWRGLRVFAEVQLDSQLEIEAFLRYEDETGAALRPLSSIAVCAYDGAAMSRASHERLRRAHDHVIALSDPGLRLFIGHTH